MLCGDAGAPSDDVGLQAGSTRRAWTQKDPTICSVTALQTALECAGCAGCVGRVGCAGVREPRRFKGTVSCPLLVGAALSDVS